MQPPRKRGQREALALAARSWFCFAARRRLGFTGTERGRLAAEDEALRLLAQRSRETIEAPRRACKLVRERAHAWKRLGRDVVDERRDRVARFFSAARHPIDGVELRRKLPVGIRNFGEQPLRGLER